MWVVGITIGCGVFGAGNGYRVEYGTARGLIAIFRGFFATIGEIFSLAGRLGAGLSFYGV